MIVYNVTFFYPPQLAARVHSWLSQSWVPAAAAAGCMPPLALSMDSPQEGVERMAVQSYFATAEAAEAFAAREASLLVDDMQARFGAQTVVAYPTMMTQIEL